MVQSFNKTAALVTGASSGIGAAYADRLAARGHDLVLVARDAGRLEALAARLRVRDGVKVDVLQADLGDKAGLQAVERRLAEDASIGVLVNNAGAGLVGSLAEIGPERAEALIALNVVALTRLAAVAAKAFSERRVGTIVNIASVVALLPGRISGVYSATKAFVLNLTQAMQAELEPLGVRVQAVLPGATRTEIFERAGGDVNALPPESVMGVEEMVDASLAGLDQGEQVTIPSLPEAADWEAFEAARLALGPNLSRNHAAARYQGARR